MGKQVKEFNEYHLEKCYEQGVTNDEMFEIFCSAPMIISND